MKAKEYHLNIPYQGMLSFQVKGALVMKEITFDVPEVSCQHCIDAITAETKSAGVEEVQVDLNSKRVYVAFDPVKVTEQQVKAAIEEAGYDIAGQQEGKALVAPGTNKQTLKLI
jgi:copper chaperone